MSVRKNKYSVAKVVNSNGKIVGYLSTKDEENSVDVKLDMLGYTIIAL